MTILNENIRYLRFKSGLTQKQLAEKAGVSKEFIMYMENREFYEYRFPHKKVAGYFGYDLPTLITKNIENVPAFLPIVKPFLRSIENNLIQAGHCIPTKNRFVSPF